MFKICFIIGTLYYSLMLLLTLSFIFYTHKRFDEKDESWVDVLTAEQKHAMEQQMEEIEAFKYSGYEKSAQYQEMYISRHFKHLSDPRPIGLKRRGWFWNMCYGIIVIYICTCRFIPVGQACSVPEFE